MLLVFRELQHVLSELGDVPAQDTGRLNKIKRGQYWCQLIGFFSVLALGALFHIKWTPAGDLRKNAPLYLPIFLERQGYIG
jgi:hypothetical protein